ncbi:hypothetical protein BJF84_12475 [Rhodococcus sp. CUA-806]|jgi:DNA-binding IclR family transcriptional regulator|nr:hypothetical protein BJF84_12475 [Rhodococcus sp. CUA-806]
MTVVRDFESSNSVRTSCSASGKVLLAHHSERDAVLASYEKHGLTRLTSRSCGSVRELESELAAVLQNGHSSECQEVMPNYGSVACPIRGKNGVVIAALSVTVPIAQAREGKLISVVRAAANDISHRFVRQFSGLVSRGA